MSTHLNEDEQLAYQNAVAMKNMMRDPDSFRLYDEMILLKRLNENGDVEYTYTIFKYGGTNGYGAVVTNEAIFKDGTYIMDYADEPDEDDPDYMEQLTVQSDLAVFELQTLVGDSDPFELVEIDVEKIKKKMEID